MGCSVRSRHRGPCIERCLVQAFVGRPLATLSCPRATLPAAHVGLGVVKDEFPVFNVHVAERTHMSSCAVLRRRRLPVQHFMHSAVSDATSSQALADAGKHARQSLVDLEERDAFQREFIANMMAAKESQLEAFATFVVVAFLGGIVVGVVVVGILDSSVSVVFAFLAMVLLVMDAVVVLILVVGLVRSSVRQLPAPLGRWCCLEFAGQHGFRTPCGVSVAGRDAGRGGHAEVFWQQISWIPCCESFTS